MPEPALVARLRAAGCVAAEEEADELTAAAGGDPGRLAALIARRVAGEPLAWVTGETLFCDAPVRVHPGVYVPRRQSEALARRAAAALPAGGCAVDLCTGSGALALALARARPDATVLATDTDAAACACAADNGVAVARGDLDAPLAGAWRGRVDVVVSVPPYVPSAAIAFLPRDARDHEPVGALDGGADGTAVLARVIAAGARLLRPGGHLLCECGAGQPELLAAALGAAGFAPAAVLVDEDGDVRGVVTRFVGGAP